MKLPNNKGILSIMMEKQVGIHAIPLILMFTFSPIYSKYNECSECFE